MPTLYHSSLSAGQYNGENAPMTSTLAVTNVLDPGIDFTLSADKEIWLGGTLTYTIVLTNNTTLAYETPVLTDALDTTLIDFVKDSVRINGEPATESQHSYTAGTLTINLDDITATGDPASTVTIEFQVVKV